jgi:hypothetical protein
LAFVSFMQAKTINGRGFVPFVESHSEGQKNKSHFGHLGQYENDGSSESFIDPTPEIKENATPPDNAVTATPGQRTSVSPDKGTT